jgi:nitroimidazol reductase NimA-like FMN-containing flavoprotein (pyridoxamine 5'-phosphate oxidase superfamily)
MSEQERESFLADVHVGVIGLTRADGSSLAVPIWYAYEPGGEVSILTDPDSIKGRALEETRWFSLCAQDETPPYKYVTVEGPVSEVEVSDESSRRAMAHRYLGPEFGDAYLESTAAEQADNRIYRMRPQRWYTVDYAKDLGG